MDELLLEAFRHNSWATKRLLEFCRELTPAQLTATAPGTYGTIIATLNHVVFANVNYLPRSRIERPEWSRGERDVTDLDRLEAMVDETAVLWERYLADPLDAREPLSLNGGAYEAESFVPVIQALHHGNSHREQICSIITALGLEPPDLQVWTYAEATGHSREVPGAGRTGG